MNRYSRSALLSFVFVAVFAFSSSFAFAQNTNSSSGQMKAGSKETAKAGKTLGHNVKHGRVVHGGKHFGKHMGKAGKHFGKGTKKAVKKIIS